jgi:hypothetical protein
MSEKIPKIVAVGEQLNVLERQIIINAIFLITMVIVFLFGNILLKLMAFVGLVIFAKVFIDSKKEIKRLKKKYGFI